MKGESKQDLEFEIQFCESILARSENYTDVMEMLAGLYTKVGRIDDGLALDQKLVGLEPANPTTHYNLACSLALKERKKEAVDALREAIVCGYQDFDWMLKDPDLKDLKAYRAFQDLLREFEIFQSERESD